MKLPFVSRAAFEKLEGYCDTEIWRLRGQIKRMREREAARVVCMEALEREAEENRRARESLEIEAGELRERVRLLAEDNQELRRRYDVTRAKLQKAERENATLQLMRASLEARLAAPSEVEGG
jgi:predicted  nucleic acid-binding Zn-ribbon protein